MKAARGKSSSVGLSISKKRTAARQTTRLACAAQTTEHRPVQLRVGRRWITLKRRCQESLSAFEKRCAERVRQEEAKMKADMAKCSTSVGAAVRMLRDRACETKSARRIEKPAVLCRWCFLPEAAHRGRSAAQCSRRRLPSKTSMPPAGAPRSAARRDYSRLYTTEKRALERAADAALAAATERGPRPENSPALTGPGGKQHCGGDLVFTGLKLLGSQFERKMPLFIMQSRAAVAFDGHGLAHATTEPHEERRKGHGAHVSFAVQTQAATLNLTSAKRRAEAHAELLAKGAIDAVDKWADAVWLPVCTGEQRPLVNEAVQTHLHHDDETMHVLRWNRVVLYDGLTGQPLVLYDAEGVVPKPRAAKKDYHRRYTAASRELQRTADAELATAVARGLPCPNLPATTQGALPAVPPGASLKEEGTVPPMPTGAFVKEEGVLVPLMPPDAIVKVEAVVKEEEGSEGRPKRQRAK